MALRFLRINLFKYIIKGKSFNIYHIETIKINLKHEDKVENVDIKMFFNVVVIVMGELFQYSSSRSSKNFRHLLQVFRSRIHSQNPN